MKFNISGGNIAFLLLSVGLSVGQMLVNNHSRQAEAQEIAKIVIANMNKVKK